MKIPKAIEDLAVSFEKLPGIGPKSAQRLTFYLLHVPQYELDNFSLALSNLKKNTVVCSVCFTVGETDPCDICENTQRDHTIICVVEEPLDVELDAKDPDRARDRRRLGEYPVPVGRDPVAARGRV